MTPHHKKTRQLFISGIPSFSVAKATLQSQISVRLSLCLKAKPHNTLKSSSFSTFKLFSLFEYILIYKAYILYSLNFTSILVWPAIYISKTVIHSKKSQCDLLFSSSSSAQSCWLLILVKCRTFSGLIDVYQWHQLLIRTQKDILNGTRKRGLNKWLKTLLSLSVLIISWTGSSSISVSNIINNNLTTHIKIITHTCTSGGCLPSNM